MNYDERRGLYVPDHLKDTRVFPPLLTVADDQKPPTRIDGVSADRGIPIFGGWSETPRPQSKT